MTVSRCASVSRGGRLRGYAGAVLAATVLAAGAAPREARGEAWVGDAGHFLSQFVPPIHLNNPDGRAFEVTLHRYIWPGVSRFNGRASLQVLDPDGKAVADGKMPADEGELTLRIPAGAKGVYRVRPRVSGYSLYWVTTSLDRAVVRCDDIGPVLEGAAGFRPLMLHMMAPRRWWFFVPRGTRRFEVQALVGGWQTHREDFGLTVVSPRGQRMAALYGGLPLKRKRLKDKAIVYSREVEVDAGAAGRFWSVWMTGGDSHNFSDLRFVLKGVPAYLASSPEQWFDPDTGEAPSPVVYDESAIRLPKGRIEDPFDVAGPDTDRYYWAPTPYLGDEDYAGFRGPADVYLRNPDNRPIRFGAGTYVSGKMPVQYTIHGPSGERMAQVEKTFSHGADYAAQIPAAGAGVYRVRVDAPTWYGWSAPAVPMVVAGADGVFRMQIGIRRLWYFRVPKGTERFTVRARVERADDALRLDVHAPDRRVDVALVRKQRPAEMVIDVPERLSGRTWMLMTAVGSPTRFVSATPESARHVRVDADIELEGVPTYLAPTWGQWFMPAEE
ncbi:MAG: hypothetical protein ACOC8F_06880 [Planctomycetota bacterium]